MANDATAAWKRERRRAFRRHHPDVGGDPEELFAALARVDAKYGMAIAMSAEAPHHGQHDIVYVFSTAGPVSALKGWLVELWCKLRDRTTRPSYFDI